MTANNETSRSVRTHRPALRRAEEGASMHRQTLHSTTNPLADVRTGLALNAARHARAVLERAMLELAVEVLHRGSIACVQTPQYDRVGLTFWRMLDMAGGLTATEMQAAVMADAVRPSTSSEVA